MFNLRDFTILLLKTTLNGFYFYFKGYILHDTNTQDGKNSGYGKKGCAHRLWQEVEENLC